MKNDKDEAIVVYTLEQAIADGVLVEIFKNRWKDLSGGKPIVATDHIFRGISLAGLMEYGMSLLNGEITSYRHFRRKTNSSIPG